MADWRVYLNPREALSRLRSARADVYTTRIQVDSLAATANELSAALTLCREDLAACRQELAACRQELEALDEGLETRAETRHRALLDVLRIVRDNDASARSMLWALRESAEYEQAFEEDEPLVTIILTTYYNWPLLAERSLPSVLAQTYEHWEAIVVGDAAPDDARRAVASFGDKRLRFVNLPYRGPYPKRPAQGWLVSGTTPFNTGLALARGRWIASNADDDALRPNHLEALLEHARTHRAEVPYGYTRVIDPPAVERRTGAFPPSYGEWNIQGSLLHAGLRFMPLQPTDWMFDIPNDWSLGERMLRIGVRFSLLEETVVDCYPTNSWSDRMSLETF